MLGPLLALVGYGIAVLAPAAVIAWGVLTGAGGIRSVAAARLAALAWCAAMAPPVAGIVADEVRAPVECGPGEECYDYILWWLAIPIGWILAALVVAAAILGGRRARPPATRTRGLGSTHRDY